MSMRAAAFLCTALALPGMALLLRVAPWGARDHEESRRPLDAG